MKNFTRIAAMTCAALAFTANMNAQTEKTWDFTKMSATDKAAFEANIAKGGEWTVDGDWWINQKAIGQNSTDPVAYADLYKMTATKPLYIDAAAGTEAEYTKGLHFGRWDQGDETTSYPTNAVYKKVQIQTNGSRIYMAAKNLIIVIPNLVAGDSVFVTMASNNNNEPRFLNSMNLKPVFKAQEKDHAKKFLRKGKVEKDGNVVLRSNGGCYVYDITVKDKDGNVKTKDNIATGIKGITASETSVKVADKNIYDLNGRCVGKDLTTLPNGVYIVNGKKVVK